MRLPRFWMFAAVLVGLSWSGAAQARRLRVDNVKVLPKSSDCGAAAGRNDICVQLDVQWRDTWNFTDNWDAVWLFAKYRYGDKDPYKHVSLSRTLHRAPAAARIDGSMDERGVFIRRNPNKPAPITKPNKDRLTHFKQLRLLWKRGPLALARDGNTNLAKDRTIDLWFMGIEMVYVPGGDFMVGDASCAGKTPAPGSFHKRGGQGPFRITGEQALKVGDKGPLAYRKAAHSGDAGGTLPAAFPKGHRGFYLMKYELTQGQYADFLNTLWRDQKTERFPYGGQGNHRFAIFWGGRKRRYALRPERAVNWLGWHDMAAYLDWAALRPITELEYEKAARGSNAAVCNEYSWGNAEAFVASHIAGREDGNIQLDGNINIGNRNTRFQGGDGGQGPLSGHAFEVIAGHELDIMDPPGQLRIVRRHGQLKPHRPLREQPRVHEGRGASGAMQLSGNLWETVVTVAHPAGRKFDGRHGDGKLSKEGNQNVETWPTTFTGGTGYRGGAWFTDRDRGMVAYRYYASYSYRSRSHDAGCRGGRTAQ